jgi:hypothetical protein
MCREPRRDDAGRALVHVRAALPTDGRPPVFGACGKPPWSDETIARCSTWATRSRKVTVIGTPESDAEAPNGGRSGAALHLEAWSLTDRSGPLEPPFAQETAYVAPTALFASAGPARPTLLHPDRDRISEVAGDACLRTRARPARLIEPLRRSRPSRPTRTRRLHRTRPGRSSSPHAPTRKAESGW